MTDKMHHVPRVFQRMSSLRCLAFLLFLLLLAAFHSGCTTFSLQSSWMDREIVIDGKSDDWVGALVYFEGEDISLGLFNDEDYFYTCMIVDNPQTRNQIMMRGLTLWFDPEGGKEKRFGIKYPLGMQMNRALRQEGAAPRERFLDIENIEERMQELLERTSLELEILHSGKKVGARMPVEQAKGIKVAIAVYSGMIVYECQVPLVSSDELPYAIGANTEDLIGVGFVSPKIDMSAMRKRMGSGMSGGGMEGRMVGGMSGRAGGMGRGRRPQTPRDLKLWTTVQLASDSN